MYFSTCNEIDNTNCMRQSDLVDKYWVTHSGNFRLATTVELGMGITDEKISIFHGILEWSKDKKCSTRYYNDRMVYDCFNNPFLDHGGRPALNPSPITIKDIPLRDKLPDIPLICFNPTSMLPLKTLVVLWPPLLIHSKFLFKVTNIINCNIPWI